MRGNLLIAAIYLAGGVALFLLGLVILRENPRERINRVTSTMMFFGGLGPILGAFGTLVYYLNPTSHVLQTGFYYNFFYLWEFFFPQLVLFSLIFPREHKLIRRFPRIWIWIYLPHLFHMLVVLFFSNPAKIVSSLDPRRLGDNLGPFADAITLLLKTATLFIAGIYHAHTKLFSSINLLYVITAILLMSRGYRALRDPLQKRQARLVLWGVRFSVGLYTVAILLPILTSLRMPIQLRSTLVIIALLTGAGSIAWAMVRHQFLGLRAIVRQSIVYSATTGVLLGAYLIVIRQMDRLVARALGMQIPYLDIAFVVIAVIFFQPLLSRIEELSEGIFRRDRSDYRNILQRLTRDIISIFEVRQLQEKITTTLRAASLTDRAALLLPESKGSHFSTCASAQNAPGEVWLDRNGSAIKLMANARGPVALAEIKKLLDSEDLEKLDQLEAHLLIPIAQRQELLGLLCLGNKMGARRYNFEDIAMLSVLANQLAIALVNSQLYQEAVEKRRIEEELARAREIQESLLPKVCPTGAGFLVSALSKPSRQVGGDYHDFVTVNDGVLGIAIGDVCGKGMPAALLMAVLQATFNAQVQNHLSVKETVSRVNAHIARFTDIDKFVTFFYGELDLNSGDFTYSNAGHNSPILLRADGQIQKLTTGGLILGFMDDAPYEEQTVPMGPGDNLFFYTDGITEAQNEAEEEFGEQRLIRFLLNRRSLTPQKLLDELFEQVNAFAGTTVQQQDDSTMVALQLVPPS